MDSTRAYQQYAGGAPAALIDALEASIIGDMRPDLTLIFDMDPSLGLSRAKARGGEDRFERKGLAFHQALRDGFLAIAAAEPKRCVVVDASGSIEDIAAQIRMILEARL
jgi:dTMP kinase